MEENKTQEYFGIKELRSVAIRARGKCSIGNRYFEDGEPILYFEKIQIASLKEQSSVRAARGGIGNYPHVIWENFHDLQFSMQEGVLSKMSFSMLTHSGILDKGNNIKDIIKVPKREILEVYNGKITTLKEPLEEKFFIYVLNNEGIITEKVTKYNIFKNTIEVGEEYNNKSLIIDYYFNYENLYNQYILGTERIEGLFTLEGKTYFKDDIYGAKKTFLFEIPKMKITSNLDIIMGEKASPTVSVFNVIGLPIKENGKFVVSRMNLLDEDIDSDI